MPIYEYKCSCCNKSIEVVQKVDSAPLKKCPKCGGSLKKVLSPPALQFKGTGWYITDYAQKNTPDKEGKDKKEPTADKGTALKDSKPSSGSG